MGTVYLVRHEQLGTRRALKILHLTRPSIADRLLREGQVQAQLQHPNVVSVLDVLNHRGMPALLMEFVEGPNLQQARRSIPLSLDAVDSLARDMLRGVGAAHGRGWVHRDLKPANVLLALSEDGVLAKVTDFGLAKILIGGESGETRSGVTMGTPGYMAPEQLRDSATVDVRADVFSLGCVLYELLAGQPPFEDPDPVEVIRKVCDGIYVGLDQVRPELPTRMTHAVHQALQVDREDRPFDALALLSLWESDTTLRSSAFRLTEIEALRELVPMDEGADPEPPSGGWSAGSDASPMTWAGGMEPPDVGSGSGGSSSPETWHEAPDSRSTSSLSSSPVSSSLSTPSVSSSLPPPATGRGVRRWGVWGLVLAAVGVSVGGLWWGLSSGEQPAWALRWGPEGLRADITLPRHVEHQPHLLVMGSPDRVRAGRVVTSAGYPAEHDLDASLFALELGHGVWAEVWQEGAAHLIYRSAAGLTLHQVRLEPGEGELRLVHLGPEGEPERSVKGSFPELLGGVFQHVLRFDRQGRLIQLRTQGPDGEPMRADDATYGRDFLYDDQDRLVERVAVGFDGMPSPDRRGIVTHRTLYQGDGRMPSQIQTLGMGGVAVVGPAGVEQEHRRYDDQGRLIERRGARAGDPSPLLPWVCPILRFEYAAERVIVRCLDGEGEPAWSSAGWSAREITVDARGYVVHEASYGTKGEPVNNSFGFASASREVDDRGYLSAFGPLRGADGEPVLHREQGYNARRWNHDDRGLVVLSITEGIEGDPTTFYRGWAMIRRTYDRWGRLVREVGLDPMGQPVSGLEGYAGRVLDVDERGRARSITFLDAAEQPAPNRDGVTRYVRDFDDRDNLVARTAFGTQGEPTWDRRRGTVKERHVYDELDQEVRTARFGLSGEPVNGADGWHERLQSYDSRGNVIESRFLTVEGELVPQEPLGGRIHRERFDLASRVIAFEAFDERGRPLRGCTTLRYEYDHLGNEALFRCEDGSGRPALLPGIQAYGLERRHDHHSREIESRALDRDGRLMATPTGVARFLRRYEGANPMWSVIEMYDAQEQPFQLANGVFRTERTFDAFGRVQTQRTLNLEGELVVGITPACAEVHFTYRVREEPTEMLCFDAEGRPSTEVPHLTEWTYDEAGRIRSHRFLDDRGREAEGAEGWSEKLYFYDRRGTLAMESWRAVGGGCGLFQGEVCARRLLVDEAGAPVRETFLDEQDAPLAPTSLGYAVVELSRDGSGRVMQRRFFSAAEAPAIDRESGAHRIVYRYDLAGEIESEERFDLDGESITTQASEAGSRPTEPSAD